MILDTLKQFNWLDIFTIIVLLRIGYVALKSGFIAELFKLFGTALAVYLAMHYYAGLSDTVTKLLPIKESMPLEFLDFIFFIALAIAGYFVMVIARSAALRLVKTEAAANLHKWGGLILGILRGFLLVSLLMYIFSISTIAYFKNSVSNSYSSKRLFSVAPKTYSVLWNALVSKFMTNEKFNNEVIFSL